VALKTYISYTSPSRPLLAGVASLSPRHVWRALRATKCAQAELTSRVCIRQGGDEFDKKCQSKCSEA